VEGVTAMGRVSMPTGRVVLAWVLIIANTVVCGIVLALSHGFGDITAGLLLASFVGVGGVLALKTPDNSEAWWLLAVATGWAFAFVLPFDGSWVVPLGLMTTQLLLRFPDGALPSPRWRWFSVASIVLIVVLTFTITTGDQVTESGQRNALYVSWVPMFAALILLLPVIMIVSAGSLVVRYRRAREVERQQIRWLAWAASTVTIIYVVTLLLSINTAWSADGNSAIGILQGLSLASFALIPISIGIAVLKYRLYDIDRVISRTASYTIVIALVFATYAAVITLLSRLVPDASDLAVAAATLAAAAAFRPLLKRVKGVVDRRFNRERYNAAQTLHVFGNHLRDVVDAETVAASLVVAVGGTLHPSQANVWLRDDQVSTEAATPRAAAHSVS
jgi:hypothetical protein